MTDSNETLEHFRQDIYDIKQSLHGVMEAVQRLAILEERFNMIATSIADMQKRADMHDERIRKLENEHIYAKASADTFALTAKIAWALGGGVVMTIITGLLKAFV